MTKNMDGTKSHNLVSRLNPLNWGQSTPATVSAEATAFIPYHYGAIAMFISGVICIAWARGNSKTGISLIVGAMAMSAWATFVPKVAPFVTVLLIVGAAVGVAYLIWRFFRKAD
jgi:hypothetical protein